MCSAPQRRALFRHVFGIWTSKSGPRPSVFNTFDLEMCFAPQRRALFRHLNFQKWSEPGVFCTFWLQSVLRATTACNFSSLIWQAGSAPAALASLLFDTPEPQIIGKTQCFATFSVSRRSYLFPHLHLLSSDLFSSDSSHLCFSTVHIVWSFTSKLPSIISTVYLVSPAYPLHPVNWFHQFRISHLLIHPSSHPIHLFTQSFLSFYPIYSSQVYSNSNPALCTGKCGRYSRNSAGRPKVA